MLISVIYGATVLTVLPGGFSHYVHLLEQYAPGAAVLVPLKALLLIPLVYHSVNGFRHLVRPIVTCKIRIGILFMRRILFTYETAEVNFFSYINVYLQNLFSIRRGIWAKVSE